MKDKFKKIISRNYYLYILCKNIRNDLKRLLLSNAKITNNGGGKIKKDVIGKDNSIVIGEDTFLNNTLIRIRGNNNSITFGKNCFIGKNCSFWMEGNNIKIIIGDNTTFTHTVHFCAQEDEKSIIVGDDCMFSNTIIVRTSDSHGIYLENGNRINLPKDVKIGNHVWICPKSTIMKGSVIHDGAIIGSNSLVTKDVPEKCLVVGMPAKVVKTNVLWSREELF